MEPRVIIEGYLPYGFNYVAVLTDALSGFASLNSYLVDSLISEHKLFIVLEVTFLRIVMSSLVLEYL